MNVLSSATSPLTDWRSIFQLGNLLSFLGIAATIYYALRAEKKANTALKAAVSARTELLMKVAAEEFVELLKLVKSIRQVAQANDLSRAEEIAGNLNEILAMAKTSWPQLLQQVQHEEIEVALRENQRLLAILRNADSPTADKAVQIAQLVDTGTRE